MKRSWAPTAARRVDREVIAVRPLHHDRSRRGARRTKEFGARNSAEAGPGGCATPDLRLAGTGNASDEAGPLVAPIQATAEPRAGRLLSSSWLCRARDRSGDRAVAGTRPTVADERNVAKAIVSSQRRGLNAESDSPRPRHPRSGVSGAANRPRGALASRADDPIRSSTWLASGSKRKRWRRRCRKRSPDQSPSPRPDRRSSRRCPSGAGVSPSVDGGDGRSSHPSRRCVVDRLMGAAPMSELSPTRWRAPAVIS